MRTHSFVRRSDGFIAKTREEILKRKQAVQRWWYPKCVDPQFVPAARAEHMRPADWVVGLFHNGQARCYPAWIMDNYHIVNDTVGGDHLAVMHCEICCSSAAYYSYLEGKRLTFATYGLIHGAMGAYDIETGSLWSHDVGLCLDGEHAGKGLPLAQTFQATYAEWTQLHPDTLVLTYPDLGQHPDARHGHGSWHNFADPGIVAVAAKTIAAPFDARFPENEMMISVIDGAQPAVLPLRAFLAAGGVLHFRLDGRELVALGADLESSVAGVYLAQLDGRALRFARKDGRILDEGTGSAWLADGRCVSGPFKGARLTPQPTVMHKWHSISLLMPEARVLRPEGPSAPTRRRYPALEHLRKAGFSVEVRADLFRLELPNCAEYGAELALEGEPFRLFAFDTPERAEEYAYATPRSAARGELVLQSTPDLYHDALHAVERKPEEIAWSRLLETPRFLEAWRRFPAAEPAADRPSLKRALESLRAAGYRVDLKNACHRDCLHPHAEAGAEVAIDGDPFFVYRFSDARRAAEFPYDAAGCVKAGPFVFRSDPKNYYKLPWPVSTVRSPDEQIAWSPLVKDPAFAKALEKLASKRASGKKVAA